MEQIHNIRKVNDELKTGASQYKSSVKDHIKIIESAEPDIKLEIRENESVEIKED